MQCYWAPPDADTFPSLKPDADISFPMPRRFRGWHQVIKPELASSHVIADLNTRRTIKTSCAIPPEMFEGILTEAILYSGQEDFELWSDMAFGDVLFSKHEILALSTVCRFWAGICREKAFRSIIMHSREDICQLLEFLTSPHSVISSYIRELSISTATLTAEPWLHLLPSLYTHLPHVSRVYQLFLTGPLPRGCRTMRSIHCILPRSPPSFTRNITSITLSNVHFVRFEDLLRLLNELGDLVAFSCSAISWMHPPSSLPLRIRTLNTHQFSVTMSNCADMAAAAIWLSHGLIPRGTISDLDGDDILGIAAIVRALDFGVDHKKNDILDTAKSPSNLLNCSIVYRKSRSMPRGVLYDYNRSLKDMPWINVEPVDRTAFPQDHPNVFVPPNALATNVGRAPQDIIMTVSDNLKCNWQKVDWKMLDDSAAHLTRLRRIVLYFPSAAAETRFHKSVDLADSIPYLSRNHRLTTKIWPGRGGSFTDEDTDCDEDDVV